MSGGVDSHKVTVEQMTDGSGVYITRRAGVWARSVEADEAVTLDYDSDGNLIGVEVAASPKRSFRPGGSQVSRITP